MIEYVIPFLLMVNLVVFVHSSGHYFGAKMFGISLETVSVGFGPKIFSFTRGQTHWKFCLLPIGGYVRPPTLIDEPKTCAKNIGVALSGPALNILFAVTIIFTVFATKGIAVIQEGNVELVPPQSVSEILSLTFQFLLRSWNVWSDGRPGSFMIGYHGVFSGLLLLSAIYSSILGIINLLPIPKLDGWKILQNTLVAYAGMDRTIMYMKWLFRFEIALVVIWIAYFTWLDLTRLEIIKSFSS